MLDYIEQEEEEEEEEQQQQEASAEVAITNNGQRNSRINQFLSTVQNFISLNLKEKSIRYAFF
jgi:hypothetical protein